MHLSDNYERLHNLFACTEVKKKGKTFANLSTLHDNIAGFFQAHSQIISSLFTTITFPSKHCF